MFKRVALGVGLALLVLVSVLLVNTIRYTVPSIPGVDANITAVEPEPVDMDRVTANLAEAVRFKTISNQNESNMDRAEFTGFLAWLRGTYPLVHAQLEVRYAGGLTPVIKWQGSQASLSPVLLTGHYDVVPVLPETLTDWSVPPFEGRVSDGYLWGRGTLDDKIAVIGLLEAAEELLRSGFTPARSVYFIFGHDEEIGGWKGAGKAVNELKQAGVEMEWSLDEGSMVLDGILPGLKRPVASINVAEKGYVTLEIKANAQGGHSSLPPVETAVGILARAISSLEDNPVPGGVNGTTADFFDFVAPEFPFFQRMLFANRWLFGSLLESELSKGTATNAIMRTTTAPTMLSASIKENVLPAQAVATVNFRIHPRDTVDSVIAHVNKVIDDDRVEVSVRGKGREPSNVSQHEVPAFAYLSTTFREVFGDVITVPGLTIAATDARHYSRISKNSYRINPIVFESDDIPRIHGTNERISIENIEKVIRFYRRLIRNVE